MDKYKPKSIIQYVTRNIPEKLLLKVYYEVTDSGICDKLCY